MSTTQSSHYENARLFRTLAERLPELLPDQAAPDKVALAEADPHPGHTIEEAIARFHSYIEGRQSA